MKYILLILSVLYSFNSFSVDTLHVTILKFENPLLIVKRNDKIYKINIDGITFKGLTNDNIIELVKFFEQYKNERTILEVKPANMSNEIILANVIVNDLEEDRTLFLDKLIVRMGLAFPDIEELKMKKLELDYYSFYEDYAMNYHLGFYNHYKFVNFNGLPLRKTNNINSNIILYLLGGSKVEVIKVIGEWSLINCHSDSGYVMNKNLSALFKDIKKEQINSEIKEGNLITFSSDPNQKEVKKAIPANGNCDDYRSWYNRETGRGCYNGNKLHTGDRGGIFYYSSNDKKVYVTDEVKSW